MATKSKTTENNNFNPIYRLALESRFPGLNVEPMLEVCYNTDNDSIAIQMLLGIFQEPDLHKIVVDDDGKVLTMTSYNAFKETVYFQFSVNKSISCYFPKDIDVTTLNHENYNEFKENWSHSKDQICHKIIFPEMVTENSEHRLSKWQSFEKYVASVVEKVQVEYCIED
jgi:hypothetical protein